MAADIAILALFNLSGGEVILVVSVIFILFWGKKLPMLAQRLGRAILTASSRSRDLLDDADDFAAEAGESLRGIYGKGAAEAITPDNQVAELYDPAVLRDETSTKKGRKGRILRIWEWLQARIERFLSKRARGVT